MRQLPPPKRIAPLDPRHPRRYAIQVRRRPSALVRNDAHPLRPQQADFRRRPIVAGDQLRIAIPVQQQVRRHAFQQTVSHDDRRRSLVAFDRVNGQRPKHPGNQPHRALPNRITPEDFLELRMIISRKPRPTLSPQPRRYKRPHVRHRRFAAEPKSHVFSREFSTKAANVAAPYSSTQPPERSPDFAIASSQASTEQRTRSTPELLPPNRSPPSSISTSMLIGSASPSTASPDRTL
jgi:hypothetical protein